MKTTPPPLPQTSRQTENKTSGHAIAALILACTGVLIFPLGVIGIVLGHVALSKCNQDPGLGGRGLAKAALIVGYGFFALVIICVLLFLFVPTGR
jgi:hypothetical protein